MHTKTSDTLVWHQEAIYLYSLLIWPPTAPFAERKLLVLFCSSWTSASFLWIVSHGSCKFCILFHKPKGTLLLSWCVLRLACVFLYFFPLLSLDLVPPQVKQHYSSIVAGITAGCDTPFNWAFFHLCARWVFSCGNFCSDVWGLNLSWHLPSHFSAKLSAHCYSVIGLSSAFGSRGCLSGWPKPLLCCY